MSRRLYRSGTGWCFWRWSDVEGGWIVRLHLIKTPWFAICLHWLKAPDPEPHLHDHPVSFLSIILSGGYIETRKEKHSTGLVMRRWFNFIRATDRHTIVRVKPRTLTICFMGPKVREWGYWTPQGWVGWKQYYAARHTQA